MSPLLSISVASPRYLAAAALLAFLIIALSAARRIRMPAASCVLGVLGIGLLCCAAGGVQWLGGSADRIVVMVDRSASTRTATFRDDAAALQRRIHELLGGRPYEQIDFGSDRASETRFIPPAAQAILLFSDARFPLPATAPPTFVVVDPRLDRVADGSIQGLEIRESNTIAVALKIDGGARTLTVVQDFVEETRDVSAGDFTLTFPLADGATRITASLSPGDAWPENDALSAGVPPPATSERWWIGAAPRTGMWRAMPPEQLPGHISGYLLPAVIVLNNVAASDLSAQQRDALDVYVRSFGGGLVMLGGDRAFAAGGWPGTELDALSPLSSTPPAPERQWILLADSSGSMAAHFNGRPRWSFAADAVTDAIAALPPNDRVDIGSFAETLRWWLRGKSAAEARAVGRAMFPAEVVPSGPTNLQSAIEQIADQSDGSSPRDVLLLTDAEARVEDPQALAATLRAKGIRVHLLATAPVGPANPVAALATATGGTIDSQGDPTRWSNAIQSLARSITHDRVMREPVAVHFEDPLSRLGRRTVAQWNRTWLAENATALASAEHLQETVAMVAQKRIGEGKVIAAAFSAEPADVEAMAALVAAPPRDPRFKVMWRLEAPSSVAIDAVSDGTLLNGLRPLLRNDAQTWTIPQVAPGRYELSLAEKHLTSVTDVLLDGQLLDRRYLEGRYALEFAALGNDRAVMRELAARTGGEVIPPEQTRSIQLPTAHRLMELTPYFTAGGATLIAVSLLVWKGSPRSS